MIAEVISIGDELTSGQRLDTNSQWLSQRLGDLGVTVVYHTTVADDLQANVRVFRQAVERADVVVATGGLGPTADDLTRDALAATSGAELVLHEASLEHIRGLFARFQRDMPERNKLQAMFPAGSRPIPNRNGTAPGIAMQLSRPGGGPCRLFALPGVPSEMQEMFEQTVGPAIACLSDRPRVIRHHRIKCFGVGESHLEQMLPDLIRRGRTPSVGITVHAATITLRITAEGATPEECLAAMQPTMATIREALGTIVFGEEDDELEHAVLRLLDQRNETLATIEVGTTGLLAHWLAEAAAAGPGFRGGIVAPGESEFAGGQDLLSREAAGAMAEDCRKRFGTHYGLAIGAFPVVDPASDPAPFYFALATANDVTVKSSTLAAHPAIWKARAAKQALNLLRLLLLHTGEDA